MNITDITNKTIYLDDLSTLIIPGQISSPTKIIIKETGGAEVLKTYCYTDFSGQIKLDLAHLFKVYAQPAVPDKTGNDSSQVLDLTIEIRTNPASPVQSYPFHLVLCHSLAATQYSDIDFLRIPAAPVPMTMLVQPTKRVSFSCESPNGVEELLQAGPYASPTLSYIVADVSHLSIGYQGRFRLTASSGTVVKSPYYQVTPGTWQRFLFRNRYGYLEYFPMSGDLQILPSYKIEPAKYGTYNKTATSECDVIMQQYTGPLTRTASKVLADMLADGQAYHHDGKTWRRIAIDSVAVNITNHDELSKQSFTFRYVEPVQITDINI